MRQDVNFDKGTIEVRQASQYLPGQGVFTKDPKTESSKRKVSVNKALLDLLRAYKDDQQDKSFLCADNNRLFVTWDDKPMFPNAMSKWFSNFIKRMDCLHLIFMG